MYRLRCMIRDSEFKIRDLRFENMTMKPWNMENENSAHETWKVETWNWKHGKRDRCGARSLGHENMKKGNVKHEHVKKCARIIFKVLPEHSCAPTLTLRTYNFREQHDPGVIRRNMPLRKPVREYVGALWAEGVGCGQSAQHLLTRGLWASAQRVSLSSSQVLTSVHSVFWWICCGGLPYGGLMLGGVHAAFSESSESSGFSGSSESSESVSYTHLTLPTKA